ncbi:MAG: ferritin-like domain-containing protein [Coriobacteriia bacterium]|nr:ferritin-like domain-containing protein [Coriobacteriia bacterium]
MNTSPEVLASLNEDLALEHGAILQYVIHGVQLRDVGITDPVRKTAREEMWHFEWLAEAIRDRGGEPVLDRADIFLSASMADSMVADVGTEDMALEHYARTLDLIGDSDPELTRLIERIVADEHHHRITFERLTLEAHALGEPALAAHPLMGLEDLGVVGPTIGTEYAGVLQYLFNKYGSGDCEQGEQYFEFAIDEMRHLSWAASYVPGVANTPVPPPVPVDRVRWVNSPAEAHAAAGMLEGMVAQFYSAKVGEAKSPELAEDLSRAAVQHEYHRYKLERTD